MHRKLKIFFKYLWTFGPKITVLNYLPWHFKYGTKESKYLFKKKHDAIEEYLFRKYEDVIEKYNKLDNEEQSIEEDSNIFILWWQGVENVPDIIRKCIESIEHNKKKHKLVILDSSNVYQYAKIDERIIEKYNKGIIKLALFSDIIRTTILSEYGGIWCDATLFFREQFNKNMYECSFYGIHKMMDKSDYRQCTDAKWSLYFMAAGKNSKSVSFAKEVLVDYCIKQNILIDYFILDYIIRLGYHKVEDIRLAIDKIPINNNYCADLLPLLGEKFDETVWNEMRETNCFKLSWREHELVGINEAETYYRKVIEGNVS